jgi:hypothetical protein
MHFINEPRIIYMEACNTADEFNSTQYFPIRFALRRLQSNIKTNSEFVIEIESIATTMPLRYRRFNKRTLNNNRSLRVIYFKNFVLLGGCPSTLCYQSVYVYIFIGNKTLRSVNKTRTIKTRLRRRLPRFEF